MRKTWLSVIAICAMLCLGLFAASKAADSPAGSAPVAGAAGSAPGAVAVEPTTAPSRIVAATVYQGTALVTREVTVPAGTGLMELVVSPMPEQTADTSLYTDGADGLRVLSTRFRTRPVQADTRAEVRALQDQIKTLQDESQRITREIAVGEQNLALLAKLENFTASTLASMTDKGLLNGDATIALTKYIMTTRDQVSTQQVQSQQKSAADAEQITFLQRQLSELTAGAASVQRDAIITIDKTAAAAGATVRLNYLVNAASWQPLYKVRTDADNKVHVEYLATVQQQSGEDWGNADVSLSTAQPMLNAAPPDLLALDLTVGRVVVNANQPAQSQQQDFLNNADKAQELRQQGQTAANGSSYTDARNFSNSAGALIQTNELLDFSEKTDSQHVQNEGPSVTFHLPTRYSIPSRSDPQLIEVAQLDLTPEFFYKAVPVLTPQVYRLAKLTNDSTYVLLPGEATMYTGKDFVGRMNMPLVAIGESFTAGFGIDPQVQVERTVVSKAQSIQGGNQVHTYTYRIRVSNFKQDAVNIQVWDRLPKADSESVGITLVSSNPELSVDPQYVREDKRQNLLRWDMKVEKGATGEKAATIDYQFKLEYSREVSIENFKVTY
jgi:uncharacterized protein (TIGR02231 family)